MFSHKLSLGPLRFHPWVICLVSDAGKRQVSTFTSRIPEATKYKLSTSLSPLIQSRREPGGSVAHVTVMEIFIHGGKTRSLFGVSGVSGSVDNKIV